MTTMPYFMENKSWYTQDEDGNLILTKSAPEKAIAEYNQLRKQYLDRVKKLKTNEELMSFFTSEPETFSFPLDEETENLLKRKFNE